jgi:hypothetical protein
VAVEHEQHGQGPGEVDEDDAVGLLVRLWQVGSILGGRVRPVALKRD